MLTLEKLRKKNQERWNRSWPNAVVSQNKPFKQLLIEQHVIKCIKI